MRGLILSSALQPIPGRVVRRIHSGEFIKMRDLLSDNAALHEQLESIQGPLISAVTPAGLRPRVRGSVTHLMGILLPCICGYGNQ